MKSSYIRDWLIDSAIVVVLAGIAIFLLPLVSAWISEFSFRLARTLRSQHQLTLFWVYSIAMFDLLPHFIVGSLMGLATARFIRHQKLWLASMPALLFCLFHFLYYSFGPFPLHWDSWWTFVIIGDWFLLGAATLLCARVVLRHRRPDDTTLQPVAVAPVN
ncbi:MAG: hypothetical protein ABSA83_10355 [Verrucomicrobiota bacterium]|jgi:hypothetical protein